MKRVLKNLKTGLFFKNSDEWTPLVDEAAGFRDAPSALRFCEKIDLTDVALLLTYADGSPHRVLAFRRGAKSQPSATISVVRQVA